MYPKTSSIYNASLPTAENYGPISDYFEVIAAIHFCSSVLLGSVIILEADWKVHSPIKMQKHPEDRDQLLLIVLVPLL